MHELWYRLMAEERLYSITEAAAKLGVSPATIATWIRLGIAKASRQGEMARNRDTDSALAEMERRWQERPARKRMGLLSPYKTARLRGGQEDARSRGCCP